MRAAKKNGKYERVMEGAYPGDAERVASSSKQGGAGVDGAAGPVGSDRGAQPQSSVAGGVLSPGCGAGGSGTLLNTWSRAREASSRTPTSPARPTYVPEYRIFSVKVIKISKKMSCCVLSGPGWGGSGRRTGSEGVLCWGSRVALVAAGDGVGQGRPPGILGASKLSPLRSRAELCVMVNSQDGHLGCFCLGLLGIFIVESRKKNHCSILLQKHSKLPKGKPGARTLVQRSGVWVGRRGGWGPPRSLGPGCPTAPTHLWSGAPGTGAAGGALSPGTPWRSRLPTHSGSDSLRPCRRAGRLPDTAPQPQPKLAPGTTAPSLHLLSCCPPPARGAPWMLPGVPAAGSASREPGRTRSGGQVAPLTLRTGR